MMIVKDMASNKYLVMDSKNTYCYNIIETMINIFLKCWQYQEEMDKNRTPHIQPWFYIQ